MSDIAPLIPLDEMLAPLRHGSHAPRLVAPGSDAPGPVALFAPLEDGTETHSTGLAPGVMLHADPASTITGHWSSPAGRLAEISARVIRPGAWFALHVTIPLPDLTGLTWIGLILRSSAAKTCLIRPCLRSGRTDGGFHDHFLARHVLSRSRESDHHEIIPLSWHPDLPLQAPWREVILFLPPAEDTHLMLHDLRIFAL
jgi:hypothetical protein